MLRSVKELEGYKVLAADGDIGQVYEFYFDDHTWTIRYLVVNIGAGLTARRVLIAPLALDVPDWKLETFPVILTKEQVANSPDIDTDKPISRQQEIELHHYYHWPAYWTSGGALGHQMITVPPNLAPSRQKPQEKTEEMDNDPHLRSTREVVGYRIQARDGALGHVEDFLIDDQTWSINYMIVDTVNFLPGKKVRIAPDWVERVDWAGAKVQVDLTKETIKNSPEYDL